MHPSKTTPYQRFGFRPKTGWLPGLLTHQFLHEGWLHLIMNMLFLWVVGSVLEGRLGRHMIWIYLTGGIAAAVGQVLWGIPEDAVMVGSSGAVSALMGFALIGMPGAKVKLWYVLLLFIVPRYGAFDAPLWFFIPLWLFEQLTMLLMSAKAEVVKVAYAAHVVGLAFGALAGGVWRFVLGR